MSIGTRIESLVDDSGGKFWTLESNASQNRGNLVHAISESDDLTIQEIPFEDDLGYDGDIEVQYPDVNEEDDSPDMLPDRESSDSYYASDIEVHCPHDHADGNEDRNMISTCDTTHLDKDVLVHGFQCMRVDDTHQRLLNSTMPNFDYAEHSHKRTHSESFTNESDVDSSEYKLSQNEEDRKRRRCQPRSVFSRPVTRSRPNNIVRVFNIAEQDQAVSTEAVEAMDLDF